MPAPHVRRAGLGSLALLLVLGVVACEGDNLFRGTDPVVEGPPRIISLVVPATAVAGGVVPVQITAVARRGLQEVLVRYTGALVTDQHIGFQNSRDTVVVNTSVELLGQPGDSLLIVEATARDVGNRVSPPVRDTVRILFQAASVPLAQP